MSCSQMRDLGHNSFTGSHTHSQVRMCFTDAYKFVGLTWESGTMESSESSGECEFCAPYIKLYIETISTMESR